MVCRLSDWITQAESILTDLGYPYSFERLEVETTQLPDTYIVYFLVDDNGKTWADGAETSHTPRIQVSLFYRQKSVYLTLPDSIETAFINAGFMRVGAGRIPYQNDTGHYGWRCDFRYNERR